MDDTQTLADFQANAILTETFANESIPCRVLLRRDTVGIVTRDSQRKIPLAAIFDIIVSRIPSDMAEFFDQSILIGYTTDQARRTIILEGEHEKINTFAMLLYQATLAGEQVAVKHPARKGGRMLDTEQTAAQVQLSEDAVRFDRTHGDPFEIALSVITDISQLERTVDGATVPVLSIRHMAGKQAVTTELSHKSLRKLNILARFLRLRYFQLQEQADSVEVRDEEAEALVALYSGGTPDMLDQMLTLPDQAASELLATLAEKGLIADQETGELTSSGQLIVSDRIDDINI